MTNGIVQRLTPFEQRHNLFIRHLVKRSKALQSLSRSINWSGLAKGEGMTLSSTVQHHLRLWQG